MRTKSSSPCGFLSLRVITILFGATTACSILTVPLLAFLRPQGQVNGSQRTLSFEERVSYQKAIEEVYWRHRIWPKERPDSKPSLDAVMSQAQIEKKVTDYLRNSQALVDYWQRPITAEQLQAEMDRMAAHTRQPEVLHELFEALGNDPFVIAECLARPALAERLITNWYAYDQRIHGELKQRAQTELQAHSSIEHVKQLSGKYSEIEFVKSNRPSEGAHRNHEHVMTLSSPEWDTAMQKLMGVFSNFTVAAGVSPAKPTTSQPTRPPPQVPQTSTDLITQIKNGVLSTLQEDEDHYYATAVIQKTKDRMRLATVSWSKEPLESWLARTETQMHVASTASSGEYTLPSIPDGGCIDDTWTATSGPPDGRYWHTAVWTGTEMIIWGGVNDTGYLGSGGRYNPTTDNWIMTSSADAPTARYSHTAVWTGNEMIIWGGTDSINYLNTGAKYNPSTDTWTATGTTNAPTARAYHATIWTGNEMIVWGGYDGGGDLNTGARYDPLADTWTSTSTVNPPTARDSHAVVWTGSEMVVWGGVGGFNYLNTGGRYDPITDNWTATSTANAPTERYRHTAVWAGNEMVIWGGEGGGSPFNTGGRYNPGTNSWTPTATTNAPDGREFHTAVWSGAEMIVWGGSVGGGYTNTGGRYNPSTNSWAVTSATNTPSERSNHTAVWTGSEMIVWGGFDNSLRNPNIGGKYDPVTDSWVPTGKTPSRRSLHTAVWTGTEMIVWGGYSYDGDDHFWNTGGKYNPATNSWIPTSTTNAPIGRESHQAVWTGNEMIVWGGYYYDGNDHYVNTGGRYNPNTDDWAATSTTNAPSARASHKGVWTGAEMIVWGGGDGINYLNTGGRYNPGTNSWLPISNTGAPSARTSHTATWSGNEMIVWGGYFFDGQDHYLNTGGSYNPNTNSWTATNTANAPDARSTHTAVWSGTEMLVWGGHEDFFSVPFFNTGGRYNAGTDSWEATSVNDAPDGRYRHTAAWTGNEMIIWGGILYTNTYTSSGGRYCVQSGPTPTPTPCTGRCEPTPRPRPAPHIRPTPR